MCAEGIQGIDGQNRNAEGIMNLQEAIQQVKKAGPTRVRCTPMPGQNVNTGNYCVAINEGGTWRTVIDGLPKSTAEDIIRQATSRVLLG